MCCEVKLGLGMQENVYEIVLPLSPYFGLVPLEKSTLKKGANLLVASKFSGAARAGDRTERDIHRPAGLHSQPV